MSGVLDAVSRQHELAAHSAGGWTIAETRREILLAHWPVALDAVARQLPPELPVDTFDGEAWLGIVACRLEAVRVRGLPPLPGLSSGPQLEVCTYVSLDGRPGIWLFSVERSRQALVEAAKRSLRLPAYRARMSVGPGAVDVDRDGFAFRARYVPEGVAFSPRPGTLEHFLTERDALYTADGGRLYRAQLNHGPWSLRRARCTVGAATIAPLLLDGPPLALCAESQDVLAWSLEEL
jgi:uncharacterized protein YqjF (DUF2071 family)